MLASNYLEQKALTVMLDATVIEHSKLTETSQQCAQYEDHYNIRRKLTQVN